MKKIILYAALAFAAIGAAPLASADDNPGTPPYTVEPSNPCCSPGPYQNWDDAVDAQHYQQQQPPYGFPYIIDSTGKTP